ncbi:hypothetical protein [Streptacidiphilus sp. PAMC 29251]
MSDGWPGSGGACQNAHLGAWRLAGGVAGYQLFNKSGHPVDDWLLIPQKTYNVTVPR